MKRAFIKKFVFQLLFVVVLFTSLFLNMYSGPNNPRGMSSTQPTAGEVGSSEWMQKHAKDNTTDGAWLKAVSQPVLNEKTQLWEISFRFGNESLVSIAILSFNPRAGVGPHPQIKEVYVVQRNRVAHLPVYFVTNAR